MKLEGLLCDLVPYDQRYEDRWVDWYNGPLGRWVFGDGLFSRASHERRNEENRSRPDFGQRFVRFGIQAKDGTPVGWFGLWGISFTHRWAEVGAQIGEPAYVSQGFGSDAMLLTVEYGFRWLDLRRLFLTTFGHNVRAQRQIEKCGFMPEGRRRRWVFQDGQYRDFLFYGLLREEWPGREVMTERLGLREKAHEQGLL
jgi:RimJ/RimL family protein N-acetyltransferase